MCFDQFGTVESCYIRSYFDGAIERGCTLEITDDGSDCCTEMESFSECVDNGCNDENIYFGYCLKCDSLNDKNCENPIFGSDEFYTKCDPMRFEEQNKHDEHESNEQHESNEEDGHDSDADSDANVHFVPYPFSKRGCYSLKQCKCESL